MTIQEEKEQLLEMAVKFGRIMTNHLFDLDYLHYDELDNDDPDFYINGIKFTKTNNGWISRVSFDFRIPDDSVTEPINEFNESIYEDVKNESI